MNTTEALFTRWMLAKGYRSGRAAAKALKVSPMGPTNWRAGHNAEIHVIERMANDLGEDAATLVIAVFLETQKGPNVATMKRVAKKLGTLAVALVLALPIPQPASATDSEGIYIMRSARRVRRSVRRITASQIAQKTITNGTEQRRADGRRCGYFRSWNRHRATATLRHPRPTAERLRSVSLCA